MMAAFEQADKLARERGGATRMHPLRASYRESSLEVHTAHLPYKLYLLVSLACHTD